MKFRLILPSVMMLCKPFMLGVDLARPNFVILITSEIQFWNPSECKMPVSYGSNNSGIYKDRKNDQVDGCLDQQS